MRLHQRQFLQFQFKRNSLLPGLGLHKGYRFLYDTCQLQLRLLLHAAGALNSGHVKHVVDHVQQTLYSALGTRQQFVLFGG